MLFTEAATSSAIMLLCFVATSQSPRRSTIFLEKLAPRYSQQMRFPIIQSESWFTLCSSSYAVAPQRLSQFFADVATENSLLGTRTRCDFPTIQSEARHLKDPNSIFNNTQYTGSAFLQQWVSVVGSQVLAYLIY